MEDISNKIKGIPGYAVLCRHAHELCYPLFEKPLLPLLNAAMKSCNFILTYTLNHPRTAIKRDGKARLERTSNCGTSSSFGAGRLSNRNISSEGLAGPSSSILHPSQSRQAVHILKLQNLSFYCQLNEAFVPMRDIGVSISTISAEEQVSTSHGTAAISRLIITLRVMSLEYFLYRGKYKTGAKQQRPLPSPSSVLKSVRLSHGVETLVKLIVTETI